MTALPELSDEDFATAAAHLLPQGGAWPRDPAATLSGFRRGLGRMLGRQHRRALALLRNESDPRRTLELLAEWERAFGLPDDCAASATDIQGRRAALVARIVALGGQSRAYFIGVAAALGIAIEIREPRPFVTNRSRTEQDRTNPVEARFVWIVTAPTTPQRLFRTGASATGEPLWQPGDAQLECVIGRLKPAHTRVYYRYGA